MLAASIKLVSAMSSNNRLCFFQSFSAAIGGYCRDSGCPCSVSQITASCSICGYGSGRNNAALITLKTVEFAPIPSASENTTTARNPGLFRKFRPANFKSCRISSTENLVMSASHRSSDERITFFNTVLDPA